MNDALEVLEEIQSIVDSAPLDVSGADIIDNIQFYIQQKRLEFVEPQGDCCGS